MGVFESLGQAIAKYVVPPVVDAVAAEIRKQMPDMLKAVVAAVLTVGGDFAHHTTDDIAAQIPGELDDVFVRRVVDPILDTIFGRHD